MWYYNGQKVSSETVDNFIAFVYIITNKLDGRKYIGKKKLKFSRKKKLKGQKRAKRFLIESDWQDYWGSNEELQEDVKNLGEENFTREIIRLCKTQSEANYFEAKEQFARDVIFSDEYYNAWISVRVRKFKLDGYS